jgi:tetratricopeptide (TPR) repeat protein
MRGVSRSAGSYLAIDRGELEDARRLQAENLRLRREIGEGRGIAIALNNLAIVAKNEGDYPAAIKLHRECLDLQKQLGNRRGIAVTQSNLGNALLLMGDTVQADTMLRESLSILRELGDKSSLASTLEAFADAQHRLDRFREAARTLGFCEALREEIGAAMPPNETDRYREIVARVREGAGKAFETEWQCGREATLNDAVADALNG